MKKKGYISNSFVTWAKRRNIPVTYKTVVLVPYYDGYKNVLTQNMINEENIKYVIKYDYWLNGEIITVPENSILEFDGGTLHNGTIIGQDTFINDIGGLGLEKIFTEDIIREGTWRTNGGGSFEQVQSDWNENNSYKKSFIKNKPTLASVATSGSYSDLKDTPAIPAEQIQVDWNQTNSEAKDFIKNKPIIPEKVTVDAALSKTSTNPVQNKVITQALEDVVMPDKPYDPEAHSGFGRKTLKLKKDDSNVLTQEDFDAANTIYVIQYDFVLGEDITVPDNCVLEFDGGSISGSNTLTYTNTLITGNWEKLINCICTGVVANNIVNPLMYGAHINSTTEDSSTAIQAAINNNKKVEFTKGTYIIDAPIVLDGNYYNLDFSNSTLKKTSSTTYNYTYKGVEYQDAAVIVYKPGSSYTSGYSILSNLIIDGVDKTNNVTGIIARYNRAITLNDIRIDRCKTGFIFGGFLNTYNKITCNDCELGFNLSDLMYSVFTECFNTVSKSDGRGYLITNCLNIEFNSCSSDNATNAAYYAEDSKISLINCSCEVKTLCIFGKNSMITIVGGRFECYQYSSPNPVRYIQLDASKLYAKGTLFHWANYGSLTTYEDSTQIAATNGSYVDIEGTVEYVGGLRTTTYSTDSLYINGIKAPHASPITLPIKTLGYTVNRPTLNSNDAGFEYYDLTLRKKIIWLSDRWEYVNGFPAIPTVGTTANRPTGVGSEGALDNSKDKGFCYFDTDLGKPIYATRIYDNGTVVWVDATGASV